MKCLKAKIITAFYEVMMDLHRRPEIELTRVIREDVLNGDFPSEFEGMSCTPLAKEMAMGLHAKWIRTPGAPVCEVIGPLAKNKLFGEKVQDFFLNWTWNQPMTGVTRVKLGANERFKPHTSALDGEWGLTAGPFDEEFTIWGVYCGFLCEGAEFNAHYNPEGDVSAIDAFDYAMDPDVPDLCLTFAGHLEKENNLACWTNDCRTKPPACPELDQQRVNAEFTTMLRKGIPVIMFHSNKAFKLEQDVFVDYGDGFWERKKDMDIEMGVVDATLIRGMKNFNEKLVAIPASDPRPLSTAAATTTTKASRSSRDRSRRRDSDRSRDRSPHTRQRSRDSAQCRYRSPKIHRGGHW